MTPRTPLPNQDDVLAAQTALLAECAELGTRPTVVALARRLGMTNPTFWRHFPQHAEQIAAAGRRRPNEDRTPGRLQTLEEHNTSLRRDNRNLTTALRLAEAVIQRLAVENRQLLKQLEAARRVTNIHERPRPGRPTTK
jgi:transposase-like protein